MASFQDYKLNFRDVKPSTFVEGQVPSFIRAEGPNFVSFLEAYYKFLETKLVKITVSSTDQASLDAITETAVNNTDLITGSAHFLVCENGVDPSVTIDGFEYNPFREETNTISSTLIESISSVYDSTNKKTIIAYRNSVDEKGYAKVMVDENTFTQPVQFTSNLIEEIQIAYSSHDNKVIIAYTDTTNNSTGNIVVGKVSYDDISGYSISFDSPIIFHSGPSKNISICYDTNKSMFVVFFTSIELIEKTYGIVGSFYDGDIFLGTKTLIKEGQIQYIDSVFNSVDKNIIVSYYDVDNSYGGSSTVTIIDSDNITSTSDHVFHSGPALFISTSFDPIENKLVVFYQDYLNDKRGTVRTCSISSGKIIPDLPIIFNDNETTDIDSVYDESTKKIFIAYSSKDISIFRLTSEAVSDIRRVANGDDSGYFVVDFKDTIEGRPDGIHMAGDVNHDGIIDNEDVSYFEKYMTDAGVATIPSYIRDNIESYLKNQLIAANESNSEYGVYYTLTPEYARNIHFVKTVDVATLVSSYIEASFSNDIVVDKVLTYNPNIERVILSYGEQSNFIGKTDVFSSFQFTYTIKNVGRGWTFGNDLVAVLSGGSGTGAIANGIINTDGELDYIIFNHGTGYTANTELIPSIIMFGGDEVHDVYLGLGDENEPLIEQEGYIGIAGKYLGHEDFDTVETGGTLKRAIYIDHYSGDPSRSIIDDSYGELYNQILLDNLAPDTYLPTIHAIEEFDTPVSAMNNLFNYSDIDYDFSGKLFLGNDVYSKMYSEIMKGWPDLTPSVETHIKSLIGRNIKDIYTSKGTEEAISFVFRILYGRDVTVWSPANHLFKLNDGNWNITSALTIRTSEDQTTTDTIANLSGRLLYNTSTLVISNSRHDGVSTLTIETTKPHNLRNGLYITLIDDIYYDGRYAITTINPTTGEIDPKIFYITNLSYRSVNFQQPPADLKISYQFGVIESATINSSSSYDIDITLSNVSGTFTLGDSVTAMFSSGSYLFADVITSMVETREYADNKNLLNGGIQLSVPIDSGFTEWGDTSLNNVAKMLTNNINIDKLQDGEYYQLYSYVISVQKDNPPLIRTDASDPETGLYTEDEIINTIKQLVHPAGFKLILEEEY